MVIHPYTKETWRDQIREKYAKVFELLKAAKVGEGASVTWSDEEWGLHGKKSDYEPLTKLIRETFRKCVRCKHLRSQQTCVFIRTR